MKTLSTLVPTLSLTGLLLVPAAAQGTGQQSNAHTGLVRVHLTPQEPRAVLKLPDPDVEVLAQRITFTAAPSGLAYDAKVGVQVTELPAGVPAGVAAVWDTRSPAADLGKQALKRDIELYARASQRLAEGGYRAESVRMREIVRELMFRLDPPSIAKRATKLLAGDIQDRAVRVSIIELAAEGYAAGGWETNAEVLQWFASMGRGQLTDGATEVPPIPAAANAGSGSVMDNLIELVLGAVGMHKQLGNEEAAKACMRLGRFYVERELGAFADGEGRVGVLVGPSIDRLRLIESTELGMDAMATDVTPRLRGIGYVGGAEMGVDATATDVPTRLRGLGYVGGAETGVEAAASDSSEPLSALGYGADVEARDVLLEEPEAEPEPVEVPVLAVGTYRFVDLGDAAAVNQDPRSLKNLEGSLERLQAQLASLEAQLADQRARLDAGKRKAKGGRSAR